MDLLDLGRKSILLACALAPALSIACLAVPSAALEPRLSVTDQGALPTFTKICLADHVTGAVEIVVVEREPDGALRSLEREPRRISLENGAEAGHADWYRSREPIAWKGKTYHAGSEWQEYALGRYLRHQGRYRGVPLLSLWPGGDRVLAVLVDQETCTFRSYHPERN
jgi:hypothetical protein